MLQTIKRSGLPGVLAADKVKTTGTKHWRPIAVPRIVTTPSAPLYGKLAAHSLVTLVEGSKGRSAEKVAEDLRDVDTLAPYTVQPSEEYKEQLAGQSVALLAECRRRLRGAASKRKPKGAPPSATPATPAPTAAVADVPVAVAEEADAVMVDLLPQPEPEPEPQPQVEGRPPAVDEATSSNVVDQSDPSLVDSSSDCDSRSVHTDDSYQSDTASTDPFGFSPDREFLADSDDESGPPRACSSTDSD